MNVKKSQHISEAKLKRLLDYNQRLREQLDVPRIPVSEASASLIEYCKTTRDPLVPSVWGHVDGKDDPFAPTSGGGCCSVM
ncbi:G-protein gamma subunit [Radiomyces spectabilis]|uniref:G-protein gamma subunit n=1 Tax=Radiomyces spectabilis TaxID=64574 RepID=UPI00221EAAC9|nr:G-protein gamma subunit [Radiomyces spectabilis]KAI8381143.1 G-protein gamma subunit [Radiomyces spectabilis]